MNNESEVGRNTLLAFLAGAAVGGVVVALTTRKDGATLRKDLRELGAQAKDRMEDWMASASSAVERIGSSLNQEATEASRQVKAQSGEGANKAEEAWKEVKKGASNAGSDLKDGLRAANRELHV